MKKIQYTRTTLEKFSLNDLHKICKYYDIEYYPSWNKKRLVEEILTYTPSQLIEKTYNYYYESILVEPIKTETPKSVRIQRIEDRKE